MFVVACWAIASRHSCASVPSLLLRAILKPISSVVGSCRADSLMFWNVNIADSRSFLSISHINNFLENFSTQSWILDREKNN